ncbi:hypothetical protein [Candidatus Nitrososphaera gargensis]|nr:hypothetical protein [Candidatus Nitrososphaera gargensis]
MTLAADTYASKSKTELIEEITRLNKELRAKNEEIMMLKKRLLLYKSIK